MATMGTQPMGASWSAATKYNHHHYKSQQQQQHRSWRRWQLSCSCLTRPICNSQFPFPLLLFLCILTTVVVLFEDMFMTRLIPPFSHQQHKQQLIPFADFSDVTITTHHYLQRREPSRLDANSNGKAVESRTRRESIHEIGSSNQNTDSISNSDAFFSSPLESSTSSSSCSAKFVEQLEFMNDVQLFSLLQELKGTFLFRMYPFEPNRKKFAMHRDHCPVSPGARQPNESRHRQQRHDRARSRRRHRRMQDYPVHQRISRDGNLLPYQSDDQDEKNSAGGGARKIFSILDTSFLRQVVFPNKDDSGSSVDLMMNFPHNYGHDSEYLWDYLLSNKNDDNDLDNKNSHQRKIGLFEQLGISTPSGSEKTTPCLEEELLVRMFSAIQSSLALASARYHDPPSAGGSNNMNSKIEEWQADPDVFFQEFSANEIEIRNLYFVFQFFLAALNRLPPALVNQELDRLKHATLSTGVSAQYSRQANEPQQQQQRVSLDPHFQMEKTQALLQRLLQLDSVAQPLSLNLDEQCNNEEKSLNAINILRALSQQTQITSTNVNSSKFKICGVSNTRDSSRTSLHLLQSALEKAAHLFDSCTSERCPACALQTDVLLTGSRAALQLLLSKDNDVEFSMQSKDMIALIQATATVSASVRQVRELTNLYYWNKEKEQSQQHKMTNSKDQTLLDRSVDSAREQAANVKSKGSVISLAYVDTAINLIAELRHEGQISASQEAQYMNLALSFQPELLILAKHYHHQHKLFLKLASPLLENARFGGAETKSKSRGLLRGGGETIPLLPIGAATDSAIETLVEQEFSNADAILESIVTADLEANHAEKKDDAATNISDHPLTFQRSTPVSWLLAGACWSIYLLLSVGVRCLARKARNQDRIEASSFAV